MEENTDINEEAKSTQLLSQTSTKPADSSETESTKNDGK